MHAAYITVGFMAETQNLARTANLLGAFALLVHDQMEEALQDQLGKGRSAAAAILTIGTRPAGSIDALRRTLGLTHSATVRLVDGLIRENLVIKLPGPDGRSHALILSTKGEHRFSGLLKRRRAVLEGLLKKLSPTACQALRRALVKLLEHSADSRQQARHICRLCEHQSCRPCPVGSTATENSPHNTGG